MTAARQLDFTLSALADPTRRSILDRLSGGPLRITDLAKPFPMSLNAVSKHVRILERAKLVTRQRAGREHRVSFNPVPLDEAADWITSHRTFWNDRLDALERELSRPASSSKPRKTT